MIGGDKNEIMTAYSILADADEKYIWLPEKRELLNDYDIMRDFCRQVSDPDVSLRLLKLIRGRGAFRMFRSGIEQYSLLEEWYSFREKAYHDAATRLCERYDLSYE